MRPFLLLLAMLALLVACGETVSETPHPPAAVVTAETPDAGFTPATIAWTKIATIPLILLTTIAGAVLIYLGARPLGIAVIGLGPVAATMLVFWVEYLGLLIHLVLWGTIFAGIGALLYAIYLHRKGIALSTIAQDVKAEVVKAGSDVAPGVAGAALKLEAEAKAGLAKLGL